MVDNALHPVEPDGLLRARPKQANAQHGHRVPRATVRKRQHGLAVGDEQGRPVRPGYEADAAIVAARVELERRRGLAVHCGSRARWRHFVVASGVRCRADDGQDGGEE